ncbi:MAG: SDR family oxidoreductase [Chitinispirillaceae bacterium]|nr:SDR family oxidoreductase [Chitinispirillaceae bacterium]
MRKIPEAVLITAGTKRLGFHLARATLSMGFSVILHFRSSDRHARNWLQRNPRFNGKVFFIRHDLADAPETVIKKSLELPCTLTGLVNNASSFSPGNLTDPGHLRHMFDIHLFVPAHLGAFFHKHVKSGWIINITDAAIGSLNTTWQNYRMSKLFLEELTRQQAVLFAPGCRVNALAPGAILPAAGSSRAAFNALADKIPLRKTGSPASLADAYCFLVKNTCCTGQTIAVDGGWHLVT